MICSYLSSRSNEILFKQLQKESDRSKSASKRSISTDSKRNIGFQTDYRDEASQTDPFSPTYTISGGKRPEVFILSDFTYGNSYSD